MYEVKKYIDLNYSNAISLDDLARISHLNKYYLSHSFKEETGISPIQYLNETRIKNAKILLESTNYSISEISRFTGFSSQSFFHNGLKKLPTSHRVGAASQNSKKSASNHKSQKSRCNF